MNKIITILRESRLARFLIPAGIMLIAAGIVFLSVTSKQQDYLKTEAEVTKVKLEQEAYTDANGNREEAKYTVGIRYTVGGKEYQTDLDGMSKYEVGDKMKIYYNPADPSQVTMTTSMIMPLCIIGGGIAMLAGGIVSTVNAVKRYNKMKAQEEEWANGK